MKMTSAFPLAAFVALKWNRLLAYIKYKLLIVTLYFYQLILLFSSIYQVLLISVFGLMPFIFIMPKFILAQTSTVRASLGATVIHFALTITLMPVLSCLYVLAALNLLRNLFNIIILNI